MPRFRWPLRGPRVRAARALACAVVGATPWAGCQSAPAPNYPPFEGVETNAWLAFDVPLPERGPDDLLPAFEESARSHGCSTEKLGKEKSQIIGGEIRRWYGVSASCDDGIIALVTLVGGHVRIGCLMPTTRGRCETLLNRISEAR